MVASRDRIESLTGLRFLVAFGILLHHFGTDLAHGSPRILGLLESLSSCVSFFFVLSGFILVHAYKATSRPVPWRSFFVARMARVYPLYLVALAVMSIPFFKYPAPTVHAWEKGPALVASVLAAQAWIPRYANLLNGPGWSLSTEIFFYAMFPLLVLKAGRILFGRPVLSFAGCWILGVAIGLVLEATVLGDRSIFDDGARFAGFFPLVRLPEFLMGMSLGAIRLSWIPSRRAVPTLMWWGASACLLVALVVGPSGPWRTAFHNSLLSPLYALVILGLSRADDPLARLLSWRGSILLGEASYALYILHFPFMVALSSVIHRFGLDLSDGARILVYLAISVFLSVVAHLALERPIRDAIRSWIKPRGAGSVAQASSPSRQDSA